MRHKMRVALRSGSLALLVAGLVLAALIPTATGTGCPANDNIPLRIVFVVLAVLLARGLWRISTGIQVGPQYLGPTGSPALKGRRRSERAYGTVVGALWTMFPWVILLGLAGLVFASHGSIRCM